MEKSILSLKLVTGEEIISRVNWNLSNDKVYALENPLALVIGREGNLNFAPVLFSANPDKLFMLNKNLVVVQSEHLREQIEQGYIQSTSKIVIPTKKIILE
jgi:uncharacterized protein YjiK